jgi:hypothetical protein
MQKYLKPVILTLLLVFLATFLIHQINLPTDDLGRHIKAGEIIVKDFSVPDTNLFSYAEPDHPFINHHWLSEVIFYAFYSTIGFSGLVVLKVLILIIAFGLVYYIAIKRSGFWTSSIFAFLAILIFVERTDVRPEIFSYLFLSLYLFIFYLYSQGKQKYLWYLIPIQLLWVNMHIYFFLGPFLILVFLASQIIKSKDLTVWQKIKLHFNIKSGDNSSIKKIVIVAFSIFASLLLNPNSIKGAVYPLLVLKNYGYDIVENKSPFFLEDLMVNPSIYFFKILIILLIVGIVLNHRRITLFDFLTGAFAIFLGWFALRNFPITALLALPVLSVSFHQSFEKLFLFLKDKLKGNLKFIEFGFSIIVIVFLIVISNANYNKQTEFAKAGKPSGIGLTVNSESSAKFYLENNITGPVFNNFDIGSYLDFYLYPESQTFVDNRPEAFNVEFWQYTYIPAQSDWDWWQVFSAHYQFNSVFFGHTDGTGWGKTFLERIIKADAWVTVYLDQHAIILVRDTKNNEKLINQYEISTEEVKKRLNNYKMDKATIIENKELEESRKKGFDYINKLLGPGVASY